MKSIRYSGLVRRLRRGTFAVALAAPCLTVAPPAYGAEIDCPLRDAPYSIDTPFIDLLAKEEAVETIERMRPTVLRTLTKAMRVPDAPSFGAIVTPRSLSRLRGETPGGLQALDDALRLIPVTAADRAARCRRYDRDGQDIRVTRGRPRVLVFEKMTGFRDGPSVDAARVAISAMARRNGWSLTVSNKGGAMTPRTLGLFDVVIWNNVSGDVLTLGQRRAFRSYVERGGGYVGIHGAAGDPTYWWDWYADSLIGTRFRGHPLSPQFQTARVVMEGQPLDANAGKSWDMTDEWYSFTPNPRSTGANVIALLDESTYSPSMMGIDLRMGDHPIVWRRCVKNGRSFYSAIGHRPQTYGDRNHLDVLEAGIMWAAGKGSSRCADGLERTPNGPEAHKLPLSSPTS